MKGESSAARPTHSEAAPAADYHGPERRRHKVYRTRNTEYHLRDDLCVAVRSRTTGDFLPGHLALHRRVHGALKFLESGGMVPNMGEPCPGESLCFDGDRRGLVTSALEAVERPSREIVRAYPQRSRAVH